MEKEAEARKAEFEAEEADEKARLTEKIDERKKNARKKKKRIEKS